MAGFDPTEEWSAIPAPSDDELPAGRARKGFSRLFVEMPSDVVTGAVMRAKRRRITLAQVVEDALRAAGVVGIAAVVVGLGGCHEDPTGRAAGSTWGSMVWDSGRWGGDDGAEVKPCTFPADLPCRMGAPDTGGQ